MIVKNYKEREGKHRMATPRIEVDEKTLVRMAKYYVKTKSATYVVLCNKFNLSTSVVRRCLNVTIKEIDPELWVAVQEKKKANIERGRQAIINPTKKPCFKCRKSAAE